MSNTARPVHRRRRRLLPALAAALAALPVAAGLIPTPVGAVDPAGAQAVPAGSPGVVRYFGTGAYEGIRAAVAATPRSCSLSDDELTALVMAPIFKEVSMAETPESAPSPMTLSRWDEWSGRWSGSDNLNANYGLYAFRDPVSTPYKRAYWTPGVGIFQYDVAGVGAPYTAAQMMDVKYIAGDVAGGMAARYCAAGGDPFTSRSAAWQPWQALGGIAKSEALFQEMVGAGHPPFSTIGLVDGIDNAGGMQMRTCLVGGVESECAYVDPAAAQGANWWAASNLDGGTVGSGEAPLPAPFYVVQRNGYEERHWKAQDTGYDVDISARRLIGQNARPMDGQPQSGLEWVASSDLCDTERPEMGCAPSPLAPEPEDESEVEPASGETGDGVEVWALFTEALADLEAAAAASPSPGEEAEVATREEDDAPPSEGESAAASAFAFTEAIPLLAPEPA
jgi:hypothetical protein